jgi:site-specific recombinase XerD
MTSLAPTLESFFTDRLIRQRHASSHTIAAYRDTFRLLLGFAQQRLGKAPSALSFTDLDAKFIGQFLDYLEVERKNSPRTRNARLAAIRSFFRYASLERPDHAAQIQRVLAIPQKRFDRKVVNSLTRGEVEALHAAPDQQTWLGRRDHALLVVAIQTGLRVSELTRLRCQDVVLTRGAHVRCFGKGRKERCTPLTTQTVRLLRTWLRERAGKPEDPLFRSQRGGHMSRDAVERLVSKHAATASQTTPSLQKKAVSPHVLRHTTAVNLLQSGVDLSVIALWLGHEHLETTHIYLAADLSVKERAIARTSPHLTHAKRYRPPDELLAFLQGL